MKKEKEWFAQINRMNLYELDSRFQYLGEGLSRKVYGLNNDYVIKVAKNIEGFYQSNVENYIYKHCGKRLREYLCPIVWFNPRMIVMARAEPLSKYIHTNIIDLRTMTREKNFYNDVRELTETFAILREDVIATSSWGIYDNKLVLIDYGCTEDI